MCVGNYVSVFFPSPRAEVSVTNICTATGRNKTVFVAVPVVKNDCPGFADSGDRYGEEGARGRKAGGKLKKSLSAEDI